MFGNIKKKKAKKAEAKARAEYNAWLAEQERIALEERKAMIDEQRATGGYGGYRTAGRTGQRASGVAGSGSVVRGRIPSKDLLG